MFAKARQLSKIGSWVEALKAYDEILAKEKTGTGKKIDATMEKAKIALFTVVCGILLDLSAYSTLVLRKGYVFLCLRCCRTLLN